MSRFMDAALNGVTKGSELVDRIEDDPHREGAILVRDQVIDLYLGLDNLPDEDQLINFLIEQLPTSEAPSERVALEYANDDDINGEWQLVSESDVRRGVRKAYSKL